MFKWPSMQRWQRDMSNLQRYHWNLNLLKNVEDNAVFLTQKVFISVNFWIVSYQQEMLKSFCRIPQIKINSLNKQKHGFLIRFWSDKDKGYRCKSGIVIFACRVNWIYAYSPFKLLLIPSVTSQTLI